MMFTHDTLRRMAERAADMTQDARDMSELCRDYYDGYQYTAEEEATLRKRKQPIVTINRVKRKVDAMIGIEQNGRVDPRALPRNPQDEEGADVATKALCFVEETQRFDVKRSAAFENLLIEGYGGVEVIGEQSPSGQTEVVIKRLRWEEIFFDPFSREKDFSDAAFMGVMKWMSLDAAKEFAAQFDADESLLDVSGGQSGGTTYDDRPQRESQFAWEDKKLKRVRVAQMYYRCEGQWYLAVFTGKGEIYNNVSPYRDEYGRPVNPMYLMSAYVDRENRRYGLVKDMLSTQDEINKRRSKLLHSLNSRQVVIAKGAASAETVRKELTRPDGVVEIDADAAEGAREAGMRPFDIIPTTDQTRGQFELLVEAKQEIDNLGPNASLLGQLEGQQSGRAIMAQQQAGLAELAPIYDSLRDWTERVYRGIWERIRQFWDGPRWIRVTDDERAPQFIGINQVAMGPAGPQMMNAIAQIDVDIIVDQSPEYATLRSEQFERLAKLAESGIPIPPQMLIEASDLRDKRKLLEMMQPDPQMAQMQQRGAMAEVEDKIADVEVKKATVIQKQAQAAKDMAAVPGVAADAQAKQTEAIRAQYEARVDPLGMRNTAAG